MVRPRDLTRLLANFQSLLHEITVIATEQSARSVDDGGEIGGKAVELGNDGDMALQTQLWIDPTEEFLQYKHAGDPVDVTFGVKELKVPLYFLRTRHFFHFAKDVRLTFSYFLRKLANQHPVMTSNDQGACGMGTEGEPARAPSPISAHPSNHTKIWFDLTVSAAKSSDGTRERHIQTEGNPSCTLQNNMQSLNVVDVSKTPPAREHLPDIQQPMETDNVNVHPDEAEADRNHQTQHHPSNWVGDDGDEDEDEVYVQSTPHFYE
ncbi:hypothetical protein J5N97_015193 [Dioscorea zingiberensis]|uniref:Uncharacterized protein n=1 Tax=Dioscorea zingiberensis TaxID=325984 RepID=A0A9D5CV88_9LILI|nr:hypothetical protein J5N97_015193 [Dioscorea zingiberensis]